MNIENKDFLKQTYDVFSSITSSDRAPLINWINIKEHVNWPCFGSGRSKGCWPEEIFDRIISMETTNKKIIMEFDMSHIWLNSYTIDKLLELFCALYFQDIRNPMMKFRLPRGEAEVFYYIYSKEPTYQIRYITDDWLVRNPAKTITI